LRLVCITLVPDDVHFSEMNTSKGYRAMAHYSPGERVLLRSDKIGTIERIIFDNPLATNTRYQVAMEAPATGLIGIHGLDIMGTLPPEPEAFFRGQRRIVREILGPGAGRIDAFKMKMHDEHKTIGEREGISAELIYEEERKPSSPGASIVFMGMKTVPAEVAGAIQMYGITALKYLASAQQVPATYVKAMSTGAKNPAQATAMRRAFIRDRERRVHPRGAGLDVFKLLQLANSHKSGPGVSTSGFHSTSGKPEYASEYADASGQVVGKYYYNLGAAMEITDQCYPLVIQQTIEHWNSLSQTDRYNNPQITMAFSKKDENWKRDYESEILLGGATPSTDFVYFCLWEITRPEVGDLMEQVKRGVALGQGRLRKTNSRFKT
jgi:hypothetical protein